MPNSRPFSSRFIDGLKPAPGRYFVYDSKTPSLALCVQPTGTKVFYRCGRIEGRYVRMKLGAYPELSVFNARKLALKASSDIAHGVNPVAEKKRTTFGELWEWYLEFHAKPTKSSWERDERRYKKHLAQWAGRKLELIASADVQSLVNQVRAKRGPYAANHVREQIRHMFAKAVELGWVAHNPAVAVKRYKTHPRERFLTRIEAPRFFEALKEISRKTTHDFIVTALFTGARRSNVCEMRWSELDLESATWSIPGDKSKNRESMTIVLPPVVLDLLKSRRKKRDPIWVFPGQGKTGHLVEPKAAWKSFLKRAGIENFRIHDLRRTLGSWQAAGGSSLLVIGKSLGHKSASATQIYARLQLDPVRQSVNAAADALLKAGDKPVVNIS